MFYQDNNDYMRDSYFYGNGINYSYPYSNQMMYGNIQNPYMQNNFQSYMPSQGVGLENMYPQIYKIINPVVNRVISNSNYQYMTEDALDNMVDTVYNIVEGDVSSLISTQNPSIQGDDTTQKNSNINTNNNRSQAYTNNSSTSGISNNVSADNQTNPNVLLKDLIKILLIKELIIRRNMSNDFRRQQNMQTGNYNYLPYGI